MLGPPVDVVGVDDAVSAAREARRDDRAGALRPYAPIVLDDRRGRGLRIDGHIHVIERIAIDDQAAGRDVSLDPVGMDRSGDTGEVAPLHADDEAARIRGCVDPVVIAAVRDAADRRAHGPKVDVRIGRLDEAAGRLSIPVIEGQLGSRPELKAWVVPVRGRIGEIDEITPAHATHARVPAPDPARRGIEDRRDAVIGPRKIADADRHAAVDIDAGPGREGPKIGDHDIDVVADGGRSEVKYLVLRRRRLRSREARIGARREPGAGREFGIGDAYLVADVAEFEHRVRGVELAIADNPGAALGDDAVIGVDDIEVPQVPVVRALAERVRHERRVCGQAGR